MASNKVDRKKADGGAGTGVAAAVTPMMAQYLEIKAANPDHLLFYHMGDFYELFFDDARQASRALGIELTKRGKHLGEDIAMCGVPVRKADEYLQKLIRAGFRVAVCEQTEDPAEAKKRGSKSVVRRDVVRLVTPGTITEDTLLDARANNFLTSLFRAPTSTTEPSELFALASIDISTGEFLIGEASASDVPGELTRLAPGEIIAGDELAQDPHIGAWAEQTGASLTPVPRASFDSLSGERALKDKLGLADIAGLGDFSRAELATAGALLAYISLTQIGREPALRPPKHLGANDTLAIDAATRANLELTISQRGERKGSLLAAMDRTVTGAGARELAARLSSPLSDPAAINARLDAVAWCLEQQSIRARLRQELRGCPDPARALARLTLGRGGPRDMAALRDSLVVARECSAILNEANEAASAPRMITEIREGLGAVPPALRDELAAALGDELPFQKRDGGFVRAGYSSDLDETRTLRDDARKVVATLQARYAEETGVRSLKVRHNNILGYFVEVTAANGDALMRPPLNETFIHRQTMANAIRFTTTELGQTEARIVSAADRAIALELEIFDELLKQISEQAGPLGELAAALAALDHHAALAALAEEENYVRPIIDDSRAFEVQAGRHPVVEQALRLRDAGGGFIENDCALTPRAEIDAKGGQTGPQGRIWLVTGPNMAGKSTFLRQNALIVVMAQMGSFVPASAAHVGVVDRLFSRVGASDDLAGGRSTFMVEMVETAGILNQSGTRSFVILDEIGRGTATFDGLSIAWSCVEHLHEVNDCRALFATHYHELTALANTLDEAANVTIDVKEWNDEIVFLHKVVPGAADRSYGIHVAKLAGLPEMAVSRAREVLERLEGGDRSVSANSLAADLPLFSAAPARARKEIKSEISALEKVVAEANPDEMTPKDALELLYDLKQLLLQKRGQD